MSAFVEKKTGLEGKRTLIHDGLFGWWSAGSIFAQDMVGSFRFKFYALAAEIFS
jgi:hypothetical protein